MACQMLDKLHFWSLLGAKKAKDLTKLQYFEWQAVHGLEAVHLTSHPQYHLYLLDKGGKSIPLFLFKVWIPSGFADKNRRPEIIHTTVHPTGIEH